MGGRAERLHTPWAAPGAVLGFLFGGDCALCGERSRRLVCVACDAALPRAAAFGASLAHLDQVVPLFEYRFPVDRLVRRFKYAGDLAIGRWLGDSLAERVAGEPRPALIVAPASTRARLAERGFNPALEIAKSAARRLRCRCPVSGLVRVRETSPQRGLGREARRRNLAGAFACGIDVRGMDVAIVDDVLTTGATAEAGAAALKRAGAARVVAWVAARTPEGHV